MIDGEVFDARQLARQIVEEARREAEALQQQAAQDLAERTAAADALAAQLVAEAQRDAEQLRLEAKREAGQIRRDARELAEHLLEGTRRAAAERAEAPRTGAEAPRTGAGVPSGPAAGATAPPALSSSSGAAASSAVGRVTEVIGLVVRAQLPGAELGETVEIERIGAPPLPAEAVGFRHEEVVLMPLGELAGVAVDSRVVASGAPLTMECGDALLGRVLDGLGRPLDDGPPVRGERWAVDRAAPSPLRRPAQTTPLATGVRAIDGLLTLGQGQRVGIFAAAGVGKSTLLGQVARGAKADVVVMCQVGERGRELGQLRAQLADSATRTVAVCATSDAPPLVRVRAVHVATAIAEWFRERRGASVLLLVDSLTRLARAQREVGLSAGEPVARHGYPPSVFAMLPRLIERAGSTEKGHITGVYTVLVAGNDFDEPIADEVRGLVDGHLVLDRQLAQRAQFPPIHVVASVSRLMRDLVSAEHQESVDKIRKYLAIYEEHREMVVLGAYKPGTDPTLDAAVRMAGRAERFLTQSPGEPADWAHTLSLVRELAGT